MKSIQLAKYGVFCLLVHAVSGCHQVQVREPLGEQLAAKDLHRFVGDWEWTAVWTEDAIHEDGTVIKKGTSSDPSERWSARLLKTGNLSIARLSWSQTGQKYVVQQWRAVITRFGGSTYINLKPLPGGEPNQCPFLFARIRWIEETKLVVQFPDFDRFRGLVEQGEIQGTEKKNGNAVSVTLSTSSLLQWLEKHPEDADSLFLNHWAKGGPMDATNLILYRARQAEDRQRYYSSEFVDRP